MRWLVGVTVTVALASGCGLFPNTNLCDYDSYCESEAVIRYCGVVCEPPDHPKTCQKDEGTIFCNAGQVCAEREVEPGHTVAECVAAPPAADAAPAPDASPPDASLADAAML